MGNGNIERDLGLRALYTLIAPWDGEVMALAAEAGDIDVAVQVSWCKCIEGGSREGNDPLQQMLTGWLCLNEDTSMRYIQWWSECNWKHTKNMVRYMAPILSSLLLSLFYFLTHGPKISLTKPPANRRAEYGLRWTLLSYRMRQSVKWLPAGSCWSLQWLLLSSVQAIVKAEFQPTKIIHEDVHLCAQLTQVWVKHHPLAHTPGKNWRKVNHQDVEVTRKPTLNSQEQEQLLLLDHGVSKWSLR